MGIPLFILLLCAPAIIMLMGIVQLCSKNDAKKKSGKMVLLIGTLLFGVEILIGYSMCSNMNFH